MSNLTQVTELISSRIGLVPYYTMLLLKGHFRDTGLIRQSHHELFTIFVKDVDV